MSEHLFYSGTMPAGEFDPDAYATDQAARAADAERTLVRAVHCWVQPRRDGEWVPGVLAQWHQDARGWLGLVAYSNPIWDPRTKRWQPSLVRSWVAAEHLRVEGVGVLEGVPPDRPEATSAGWGTA